MAIEMVQVNERIRQTNELIAVPLRLFDGEGREFEIVSWEVPEFVAGDLVQVRARLYPRKSMFANVQEQN